METSAGFRPSSVWPSARSSSAATSPFPAPRLLKSKSAGSSRCEGMTLPSAVSMELRMFGISFSRSAIRRLTRARFKLVCEPQRSHGMIGKFFLGGELHDVALAAVGERANHSVAAVVRAQDGRHGLERADVEQVQQKSRDDVVSVVAERDFGAALLDGDV